MKKSMKRDRKQKGKINRIRVLFLIEFVCIIGSLWNCFRPCTTLVFDQNSFWKVCDRELVQFGEDAVGMELWQEDGSADVQPQGFELMACSTVLGSGAYRVRVDYDSASSPDGGNIDHFAGSLLFRTEYGTALRASDLRMADGQSSTESVIWLRPGSGRNEVRFIVWYQGNGRLAVKEIRVEEKRAYRVVLCLGLVLFFCFLNAVYLVFVRGGTVFSEEKTKLVIAGTAGIILFSSIVYFSDFLYTGHDLRFHLSRMTALAEGIRELQIPNRMQFGMLNGYGYASPLFYGEMFLLLPAVLYNLYVPVQTCYQVFVVLVNTATCLVSFWCFVRMSGDWKKGLFGSFLYTLSAYRMTNIMVRAAVGEYTAMIFLPLLVYGFWNIYTKPDGEKIRLGDCLPLVWSASGIIQSHMLSCEMAAVFVLLFAVCGWKRTFRRNVFAALVKSLVLLVLLNLWFILPFLQSVRMGVNLSGSLRWIESNGVYLPQLLSIFHTASGGNVAWGTKGEMPLALGVSFVCGLMLYLWIYIRRDSWKLLRDAELRMATVCMAFGMTAAFLASSFFWWDNLVYIHPRLAYVAGMVQFPWRYLGLAAVFFTVMVLYLLRILEKRFSDRAVWMVMAVFAASVFLSEGHFIMEFMDTHDGTRVYTQADLGTMTVMGAEYKLAGTDLEGYKRKDILHGDGVEDLSFTQEKRGRYQLSCANRSGGTSYVDVPVQMYDHYHAYGGDRELELTRGENNRIRVLLPMDFEGKIELRYEVPLLWRFSEAISGITFCMILWFYLKSKKNGRGRVLCGL